MIIQSIIYYTIRSPKLQSWLTSPAIEDALQATQERSFVDLDPIFNHNLDEDFDFRASGITRSSFCAVYFDWIQFCFEKRVQNQTSKKNSSVSEAEHIKSKSTNQQSLSIQVNDIDGMSSVPNKSYSQTSPPQTSKSDNNADDKQKQQSTEIVR